jgi:phage shock protein C
MKLHFDGGRMKNLHISDKEKILTGVCAGIGESFGINANIVRGAFLISLLFGFSGFFVYLILSIILPKSEIKAEVIDEEDQEEKEKTKIVRSWDKRMLAGVCGGFANYLGWDVSLIRIAFVAMTMAGGIGIFLYLFFWFIFPNEE